MMNSTSPSVYMLIPTAKGTNTLGPAGPSTTNWILELDLEEVSTIIDGTVTRQLTLNDLGTDCAQSAEPSAIATMVDSRCDPILAAPEQVSAWADPCNACGRFGLFDPPYAIPTITGGLIETTTASPVKTTTVVPVETTTAEPVETTDAPISTSTPVGIVLVVTYLDGEAVGTSTMTSSGISGTVTSSVVLSSTSITDPSSNAASTSGSGMSTSSLLPTTTPETSLSTTSPATLPTTPGIASATRLAGGIAAWFASSVLVAFLLL